MPGYTNLRNLLKRTAFKTKLHPAAGDVLIELSHNANAELSVLAAACIFKLTYVNCIQPYEINIINKTVEVDVILRKSMPQAGKQTR